METPKETIARIAKAHLGIKTLEHQNSDSLDFHDLAVWQIEEALMEAYKIGRLDGRNEKK